MILTVNIIRIWFFLLPFLAVESQKAATHVAQEQYKRQSLSWPYDRWNEGITEQSINCAARQISNSSHPSNLSPALLTIRQGIVKIRCVDPKSFPTNLKSSTTRSRMATMEQVSPHSFLITNPHFPCLSLFLTSTSVLYRYPGHQAGRAIQSGTPGDNPLPRHDSTHGRFRQ